jgi:hypothetical protein
LGEEEEEDEELSEEVVDLSGEVENSRASVPAASSFLVCGD